MKLSRRELFRKTGILTAGISVSVALPGCSRWLPPLPSQGEASVESALAWLQLTPQGEFNFISPRQEMGQGISMGLKQIIAEELGVNIDLINLKLLRTDHIQEVKSTVGSDSIAEYTEPVAMAAACLRNKILARASGILDLDSERLEIIDEGVVSGGRLLRFKDIAAGPPIYLSAEGQLPSDLKLYAAREKRYVGQPIPTDRIRDIVTGMPLYVGDKHLDGMLYGNLARPPKLGAKIRRIDYSRSLAIDGVSKIIECFDTVAVVGETPMAVQAGLQSLEIDWETPIEVTQEGIDALIDVDANEKNLEHSVFDEGETKRSELTVDLRVDIPMAAHMAIEPRCSVASWQEDCVEVWAATQDAFMVRDAVRKYLGIPTESVIVHSCRSGGSFGGGGYWPDVEAAFLSRVVDKPVKVQWSRPENFQQTYHRPPSAHRLRLIVDEKGLITHWWHRFKSGHIVFTSGLMPPWMQSVTSVVSDFGVERGSIPPYGNAKGINIKVEFSDVRMPVDTGPWRGLGAGPNCFAIESAVDAAALKSGHDPIAFRLKNLTEPRLKNCLERVRQLSGWKEDDHKTGRGVACGIYKENTFLAVIADMEVQRETGKLKLTHLYCVHDCGLVINPDQVRAQIEGNLIWGIGMITKEHLGVLDGRLSADYPGQYQLPTITDVPPMTIELVNEPGIAPAGAAESAIVGVAAISNALSGLLSRPFCQLPINMESIEVPS